MNQKIQKIITCVKFQKNEQGQVCGFVTKKGGSWRGCRPTDGCKRRIVLVDDEIVKDIKLNVLYKTVLLPMSDGKNGYIAIKAEPMKFRAKVETELDDETFRVRVIFGNKVLLYDPTTKSEKTNNVQNIAQLIRERDDMENNYQIAEEFLDSACLVQSIYKRKNAS